MAAGKIEECAECAVGADKGPITAPRARMTGGLQGGHLSHTQTTQKLVHARLVTGIMMHACLSTLRACQVPRQVAKGNTPFKCCRHESEAREEGVTRRKCKTDYMSLDTQTPPRPMKNHAHTSHSPRPA